MALYVQKFGGTSVGSVERIKAVADKVKRYRDDGHQVVVVVSAMSGETNRLIELAGQINDEPTPREMDMLVSTGEQVTSSLLAMALHKLGVPATSYTGGQVGIQTDSAHTKARIQRIETDELRQDPDEGQVVVVAGFQGIDGQARPHNKLGVKLGVLLSLGDGSGARVPQPRLNPGQAAEESQL